MTRSWVYEIRVEGQLSERWTHWFDDMDVHVAANADSAVTTLVGAVVDQAALLGLLHKLYTLGLPLLSVQRREGEC